jgi:trimeric autotransporter adhesin
MHVRIAVLLSLVSALCSGQSYVISTFAGGAPPPTPVAAVSASIGVPQGVVADASGNIYFTSLNCLFKIDVNGVLTRIAGTSRFGYSGDGGLAVSAQLAEPHGLAVDGVGNIYVADAGNGRIRKIATTGIITTVAGGGGSSVDGGPATSAQLGEPYGVAVDAKGNMFIGGYGVVKKVSPSGVITTVAGGGAGGVGSIDAFGVAVDLSGNLYIADHLNQRVLKLPPNGTITTVAGNGTTGFSGDGGPATNAQLDQPYAVAVDGTGDIFIADAYNGKVRKVSSQGVITTVAGSQMSVEPGDGVLATVGAGYIFARGVTLDSSGNLYIADGTRGRIRKVVPDGIISTVAGNGQFDDIGPYSGDHGPATNAQLSLPAGIAADAAGNVYIADRVNNVIRRVTSGGIITTIAGNGILGYSGDGGIATAAELYPPYGVAVDASGNLYEADSGNFIRKISTNGIITTVAGTGIFGYSGDGGIATNAQLNLPSGIAVDVRGNLYIADTDNNRIRKVDTSGIISTIAGNGVAGYSGDGGLATSAELAEPGGIAVDEAGNVYIADTGNNLIRRIDSTGLIETISGSPSSFGYSGDGGPASAAQLFSPTSIAVDPTGALYIADSGNARVRKITATGTITSIAGNGLGEQLEGEYRGGYSGDGGFAVDAELFQPTAMALDGAGNMYISDSQNDAIRLLQPTDETVIVSAIVDAASEMAGPITPGKIVTMYGGGLGPASLALFQVNNGTIGTQLAGTAVSFNGIAAPLIYTSSTQVAAIVPYEITGTTAQVTVSYQGQSSTAFTVRITSSAPSLFSLNQTGAGQVAAINVVDGTVNTAANPVKIGGYISLYATGEGQTTPAGVDGKIASGSVLPAPNLKVSATVGGIPAVVQYAGAAPGEVAGVMQVNVQIPQGVQPGGYVPVVLQVGDASTTVGAVWIAVAGN